MTVSAFPQNPPPAPLENNVDPVEVSGRRRDGAAFEIGKSLS